MKMGFLVSGYQAFETPNRKPEMSQSTADIAAARDLLFSVLTIFSALVETNEQSRATSANNSDSAEIKKKCS